MALKTQKGRKSRETPRLFFLPEAAALITAGLVEPLQSAAWQKSGKKPAGAKPAQGKEEEEEDVSANEDLMREHGGLNRILLIYDEPGRRLQARESFDAETRGKPSALISRFILAYPHSI